MMILFYLFNFILTFSAVAPYALAMISEDAAEHQGSYAPQACVVRPFPVFLQMCPDGARNRSGQSHRNRIAYHASQFLERNPGIRSAELVLPRECLQQGTLPQ